MLKKTLVSGIFCVSVLGACTKSEEASTVQTVVRQPITYVIRPSNIYWTYQIKERFEKTYLQSDSLAILTQLAQAQVKKAVSLEQQDLQKSIHWYQRALTYFPSIAVYARLGELLMQEHELGEARDAIRAAIEMHDWSFVKEIQRFDAQVGLPSPNQTTLQLLLLRTMAANQYYEELIYELTTTYEKGWIDKNTILNDPIFEKFRQTPQYKLFYAINLSAPAERNQARLNYFLEQFPIVDLPFRMGVTPPKLHRDMNFDNPFMMENPIQTKYNEGLKTYINSYVGRFKSSQANYDLLMVSADTTSMESVGANFRCFNYILFTLTKGGEIIDKASVAYRSPFEEASCEINATGTQVTMELFERKWKNDYFSSGKDNELLSTSPSTKKVLNIGIDGKFIEVTP